MWSNQAYSEVGDIYVCEMNKFAKTTDAGVSEFKNEKFKFNRKNGTLNFGSSEGFFNNHAIPVIGNHGEIFYGGAQWDRFVYVEGKFVLSNVLNLDTGEHAIHSVVATCDIF